MNPLKKRIGVLGGGQLGRMMIEETLRLNLSYTILENDKDCPCATLCDHFIEGSLMDETKIRELAAHSDVLTWEIEHVNTDALLALEAEGKEIIPRPSVLKIIQDKGLQKQFYQDHHIPTSEFYLVETASEWLEAIDKLPGSKFVAKTRKGGYDGKGVAILSKYDIQNNLTPIPFDGPCLLEAFVPCQKELAVIVARDREGNMVSYPSIEMEFDPQANLVTLLFSPAKVGSIIEEQAEAIARQLIAAFDSPGIFAVEMFLTPEGELLVNEVAPRAHNSGHHTIEACYTSQFEQLARILVGLPLGSTQLIQTAGMINLLGAKDFSGSYQLDKLSEVSKLPGVFVHLYAKKESKPMRKMGHVTIMAENMAELHEKANYISKHLVFVKD
jgi:5-(carboxyamino)imidazole ribonucleotide synthase